MDASSISARFRVLLKVRRALLTEKYFEIATDFADIMDRLALRSKGGLKEFLQIRIKVYEQVN